MTIIKRLRKTITTTFTAILVFALLTGASPAQSVFLGLISPSRRTAVKIPSEVIFRNSADAVFMLETFSISGETIRTGSGFFISETGLAVTNLHVFDYAASATITLYNGDVYAVRGVNATSEKHNLVMFSIDSDDGGWDYLPIADSDLIETGNSVYVIGSPLELINTMTAGIIGNVSREVNGESLIQITAPISFGSGGSALLNTRGEVIGVASQSYSYGQNLNLAVPINRINSMDPGEPVSLAEFIEIRESGE